MLISRYSFTFSHDEFGFDFRNDVSHYINNCWIPVTTRRGGRFGYHYCVCSFDLLFKLCCIDHDHKSTPQRHKIHDELQEKAMPKYNNSGYCNFNLSQIPLNCL